jgi:hypothetical protein
MKELQEKTIYLPESDPIIFSKVVDFIYTGEINVDDPVSLLQISSYLQIDSLSISISKLLSNNINSSNIIPIYDLSVYLEDKQLIDKCLLNICFYIKIITSKSSILDQISNISKESLKRILKRDDLCDISEYDLFKLILWWAGKYDDNETKKQDVLDLLQFIKFEYMNSQELIDLGSYQLLSNEKLLDIYRSKTNLKISFEKTKFRKPKSIQYIYL